MSFTAYISSLRPVYREIKGTGKNGFKVYNQQFSSEYNPSPFPDTCLTVTSRTELPLSHATLLNSPPLVQVQWVLNEFSKTQFWRHFRGKFNNINSAVFGGILGLFRFYQFYHPAFSDSSNLAWILQQEYPSLSYFRREVYLHLHLRTDWCPCTLLLGKQQEYAPVWGCAWNSKPFSWAVKKNTAILLICCWVKNL